MYIAGFIICLFGTGKVLLGNHSKNQLFIIKNKRLSKFQDTKGTWPEKITVNRCTILFIIKVHNLLFDIEILPFG